MSIFTILSRPDWSFAVLICSALKGAVQHNDVARSKALSIFGKMVFMHMLSDKQNWQDQIRTKKRKFANAQNDFSGFYRLLNLDEILSSAIIDKKFLLGKVRLKLL